MLNRVFINCCGIGWIGDWEMWEMWDGFGFKGGLGFGVWGVVRAR